MRKLIIAPSFLSKSLYQHFFKLDQFYDVKIVSKEELFYSLFGSYNDASLADLMIESDLTYQQSKLYLRYIPYINKDDENKKIHDLFLLKDYLNKTNHVLNSEYIFLMYQNNEVDIYGYSKEDKVLNDIINKLSIKPTFKYLSNKHIITDDVLEFVNIEDEAFYIMNEISSLIHEGVLIDDILIYSPDDSYNYFFDLFGKSFNFKIQTNSDDSYYSLGITSIFVNIYKYNKDINTSIEELKETVEKDDYLIDLINLINMNTYKDFSFEQQYDFLINIFKETSLARKHYKGAVQIINKPTFVQNKHIFVVGFRNGLFPSVFKDNDYLNDEEKNLIGINDSLTETKSQHDLIVDFLSSDNTFRLSYCLRSSSSNYYPSPFVTEFNLKIRPAKFPDVIYSKEYADFYYTKALDNDRLYKEKNNEFFSLSSISKIKYCSYDNQIGKIDAIKENDDVELSFTSVDRLFNCPFSYYLDKIIKLDDFESTFNVKIGNIAHYVFQHCFEEDFDFDKCFEIGKSKENPFSDKEELLLIGLKEDIKNAVKANQMHLRYIKNYEIFTEQDFSVTIDSNTTLVGKIDKGIVVDDKYLVIVDYKTGSKAFDDKRIELGLSLQLPVYCYLSSENEKYKDYQIGGIYINNVINNNTTTVINDGELISDYLKLNGKTLQDEEFVRSFDSSIGNEKSSFVSSLRFNAKGVLSGSSLVGKEKFDEYIEVAKEKIKQARETIRNNDFKIAPIYIKGDSACKYCSYKDVCFVNPKQYVFVEPEAEEEEEE